jgi:hypothetical protein
MPYSAQTPEIDSLRGMWGKSKPGDYTSFRTFIFGITRYVFRTHLLPNNEIDLDAASLCFQTVSSMKVSPKSLYPSVAKVVPMTRWCVVFHCRHVTQNSPQTDPTLRQLPPDSHAIHALDQHPARLPILPPGQPPRVPRIRARAILRDWLKSLRPLRLLIRSTVSARLEPSA